MPTAGPNSATAYDNAAEPGDVSWNDSGSIIGEDDAFAYIQNSGIVRDTLVTLFDYGAFTALGSDQSTSTDIDPPDPPEYRSYGGAANLWGATLTPAVVNDADFGVLIQWTDQGSSDVSDAFWVGDFGFAVPGGATIDGVLIEIRVGPNNGGDFYPGIDNVRATVWYTEAGSGNRRRRTILTRPA